MAKTVAYFYDPDVGNFHYGAGGAGPAAGLGGGAAAVGLGPRGLQARVRPSLSPLPSLSPFPSLPPLTLPVLPHPRPRSELQRIVVPGGRRERPLWP